MRLPALLSIPFSRGQYRVVGILAALMLVSAVTEGIGLVLLVPMLTVVGGGGADNRITQFMSSLGIPLELSWLLCVFVALVLLRAAINFMVSITSFRLQMSVVDDLRARAWSALLHCDWRYLSGMRQSDSASLIITNVDRVGYGLAQGLRGFATLVTLTGIGAAAFAISPHVAVFAFAVGAAVLVAYRGIRRRATELGEELSNAYSRVYARLTEGLGALRVIKIFGREDQEAGDGIAAFVGLRRTQLAYLRSAGLAQVALQGGGALLLALLVWFAIDEWHAGPAEIIPLVALFARALPLLESLQQCWQDWAYASPAAASAMKLIRQAEAEAEERATDGLHAPALTDKLVIDGVSVQFDNRDRPALKDANLELPARSITVITGPSGAGKSTLADIVGGLISPDEGSLRVDGVELDGAMRRAWRERVTYVQQEPVLFTGTIRENLLWANRMADNARLDEVLDLASAGFVHHLPSGLDTLVGESGRQLSGGERQRIVLARALLRNPSLLILDEASSALDAENEEAITRAVAHLRGSMTIVIIGHRGALTELAERTVRIEAGRIVSVSE